MFIEWPRMTRAFLVHLHLIASYSQTLKAVTLTLWAVWTLLSPLGAHGRQKGASTWGEKALGRQGDPLG